MATIKRSATAGARETTGFGTVLRRLFGIGFVEREGTLVMERLRLEEERDYLPTGVGRLGTINSWYRVRFVEAPDPPQGYVHATRVLNRVKPGERVAIQVDPGDGFVRRMRPLDRKLRWWQV